MPPTIEHQANHEATRWRELTRKADDSLSAKQDEALHYRTQFEAMRLQVGQCVSRDAHMCTCTCMSCASICIGRSQLSAACGKLYVCVHNTHAHAHAHICTCTCT